MLWQSSSSELKPIDVELLKRVSQPKVGFMRIKDLLLSGANPNAINIFGYTSLMIAAEKNRGDLVDLLILHSACIDQRNYQGNTAIHLALFKGHVELAKRLQAEGGAVDIKNKKGVTAEVFLDYFEEDCYAYTAQRSNINFTTRIG